MADRLTRRSLIAGGGALAAAAFAPAAQAEKPVGEAFYGAHQAGVATPPQTHAVFLGLDLRKGTRRDDIVRLMRLLSDDAMRLTQGRGALADSEPELAATPARLTFTFGFGPGLFRAAGLKGHEQLPAFQVDRLQDRWSGGDLLVQLCCDDQVTLAHALRMTIKDTKSFATVRWTQRGFRQPEGTVQRNLMGQIDGTVNPADLDRAVWIKDGSLKGGTMLVLRRIEILMDTWDAVDRVAREFTVGRRLSDGAPLTGPGEPDFAKLNPLGFPVIAEYAHIRRAHVADPGMRMLRRVYNYDEGLLFAAYVADVERQFTAVQRRLAKADLLNEWTRPIGSAVFAIPPGCAEGGWIGETLLGD